MSLSVDSDAKSRAASAPVPVPLAAEMMSPINGGGNKVQRVRCSPDSVARRRQKILYQSSLCNFVAKYMNEYADAHGTGADDDGMTSHLLERIQQKYPAVKGLGI